MCDLYIANQKTCLRAHICTVAFENKEDLYFWREFQATEDKQGKWRRQNRLHDGFPRLPPVQSVKP